MTDVDIELEGLRLGFQEQWPDLYDYISRVEQATAYDSAGLIASGALTGEQAACRLFARAVELRKASSDIASNRT